MDLPSVTSRVNLDNRRHSSWYVKVTKPGPGSPTTSDERLLAEVQDPTHGFEDGYLDTVTKLELKASNLFYNWISTDVAGHAKARAKLTSADDVTVKALAESYKALLTSHVARVKATMSRPVGSENPKPRDDDYQVKITQTLDKWGKAHINVDSKHVEILSGYRIDQFRDLMETFHRHCWARIGVIHCCDLIFDIDTWVELNQPGLFQENTDFKRYQQISKDLKKLIGMLFALASVFKWFDHHYRDLEKSLGQKLPLRTEALREAIATWLQLHGGICRHVIHLLPSQIGHEHTVEMTELTNELPSPYQYPISVSIWEPSIPRWLYKFGKFDLGTNNTNLRVATRAVKDKDTALRKLLKGPASSGVSKNKLIQERLKELQSALKEGAHILRDVYSKCPRDEVVPALRESYKNLRDSLQAGLKEYNDAFDRLHDLHESHACRPQDGFDFHNLPEMDYSRPLGEAPS